MQKVEAMRFTLEALTSREQSDLAGARAWFDKSLALYPDDPHLLNLSAITSLDEGEHQNVRQVFLKLLENENQPTPHRFI